MKRLSKHIDFAPTDLTDGRDPLDWDSKYKDPKARRGIRFEAAYLVILLFVVPSFILVLWLGYPQRWFNLTDEQYRPIIKYGLAWLAGVLGGTLHDVKWLYHVVAHKLWHLDRRLWRFFTPHVSGALAFVVLALISSRLFGVFDRDAVNSPPFVVGIAFLVGYFSDNALAKLAEIAEKFFGAKPSKEKQKSGTNPEAGVSDTETRASKLIVSSDTFSEAADKEPKG